MPELMHGVNRSLAEMHKVLIPYFLAGMLVFAQNVTPCIHSLEEGTLLLKIWINDSTKLHHGRVADL
ncbi:unnamed protein product [Camellia sinensis]